MVCSLKEPSLHYYENEIRALQRALQDAARQDLRNARCAVHLAQLRACEEALKRLEEGRYGLCSQCGEAIELNLLTADPTQPHCRACQQQQ